MIKSTGKYQYLFLFFILLMAYFPITSFLFSLKNDAFTGYFPAKYFFSTVLKDGIIPIWNPYLNFGFPMYGDMSMAWWNPFTWLIATFPGYTAASYTFEEIFYILFAAFAFYQLTGHWKWHNTVRINAALSYACSGYFIGHLQHFNWISGMAFFPLILLFYLKLLEKSSPENFAALAISTYLFCTAAHPGLIIGAIYFFLFILVNLLFKLTGTGKSNTIHFLSTHIAIITILLFTLLGPAYAYLQVLPHITRGTRPEPLIALAEASGWQTWLSLLFPFATTKNDAFFSTDIAMRNNYIGLTSLFFFIASLSKHSIKNSVNWFLIIVFFALLAEGGWFSAFAYEYLPLIGFVRLTGEFTIFALTGMIIVAGFQFDQFLKTPQAVQWKKIVSFLKILISLTLLYSLINIVFAKNSIFFVVNNSPPGVRNWLKWIVDSLSFYDCLLIQGIIQFVLVILLKRSLSFRHEWLKWVIAADLILSSLLNIPYTGVGKTSPGELQMMINEAVSNKEPDQTSVVSDTLAIKMIGDKRWYQRIPGNPRRISYPMILSGAEKYFDSPSKNKNDLLPFAFTDSGHFADTVKIIEISPSKFKLSIVASEPSAVTIQQMKFPGWQVQTNLGRTEMLPQPDQLISFAVTEKTTSAEISFSQPVIVFLLFYSAGIIISLALIYITFSRKKRQTSR